jgi:hypothetical protein
MAPLSFRLLTLLALILSGLTAIRATAQPPATGNPKPGMTADEVRRLYGPPRSVARQILYGRYLEQWTYDSPAVRVEFDWRKGQPKQIQSVQLLSPPPR